ncbi:MAG: hypothetical protein Q9162_002162 [Coniocarpon cinnabarinum]
MLSNRVPLASNPNAVNSPRRVALAPKRGHSQLVENDDSHSPPKKRQNLGTVAVNFRRAQKISANEPEGKVFAERRDNLPQSQFQRKLLGTQDGRQGASSRHPDQTGDGKEQRHEQFFSKDVTHVVTLRQIPSATILKDEKATIDPAILSRGTEQHQKLWQPRQGHGAQDTLARAKMDCGQAQSNNDVLHRARELGIKVWALEKFERIVATMLSVSDAEHDDRATRPGGFATHPKVVPLKRERGADDLSQLLRNEKNNTTTQRKPWQEIIPFKGVYLFIHDMDEMVKPVMIREYPVPARKEGGEWPMLRSVSKGRCPFVEEPPQERRNEQVKAVQGQDAARRQPPRLVRAHTAPTARDNLNQAERTRSKTRSPETKALRETGATQNQFGRPGQTMTHEACFDSLGMSRQASGSTENMPPLLGSTHANFRGIPRNPGGEPLASGLQAQNITSAIRSQMYSSTAPSAPGTRVGMSKQQHQMSRKVLERQSGLSGNSVPSSFNVNDVRAAINDQSTAPRRSARQKDAEGLHLIREQDEWDEDSSKVEAQLAKNAKHQKKAAKRDPKPGYCENCRDKYEDFQEHIVSKKHQKFATSDDNWKELDDLLDKLVRV